MMARSMDRGLFCRRRLLGGQGLAASALLLAAVALLLTGPGCRSRSPTPPAVAASGALVPVAGNLPVDGEIRALQQALLRQATADAETWVRLAQALLRKARQTSSDPEYAQAEDAAARALRIAPQHAGAHHVQLAVLLHDHRFREAQAKAAALLQINPRDATAWGAMGDSAVELGDYSAAQHAVQAMIDLKPDLRSYSRGAWLRYLFGDADGAIDLMQQAIDAGSPRDPEPRAYCRVQRAELLFLRGRYPEAMAELERARIDLPGYAVAQAAHARVLLHALDDPASALPELSAALSRDPHITTRISLFEAHEALGQHTSAAEQRGEVLRFGPRLDPRALSLFLASRHEQPDRAVELARSEAQNRPDLWSYDALAWALYHAGHLDEAWSAMQRAIAPGIVDPRIDYHRGVLAQARGDLTTARSALLRALATSPRWDRRDAPQARELLQRIEKVHPAAP